jgi:hypothetical protein
MVAVLAVPQLIDFQTNPIEEDVRMSNPVCLDERDSSDETNRSGECVDILTVIIKGVSSDRVHSLTVQ